ncbi:hypothetical protein QEN19_000729 [Hanseniaspora menglaensis]
MCTSSVCNHTPKPFALHKSSSVEEYLEKNKQWSQSITNETPNLFSDYNSKGQQPHTLFIGCGDSRYNESIFNVKPGEIFGLQTVGNNLNLNDETIISTLEFTVLVLGIEKIAIVGHTDCGAVNACFDDSVYETLPKNLKNYLKPVYENIKKIKDVHKDDIPPIDKKQLSLENVKEQAKKLLSVDFIKEKFENNTLQILPMIYNVENGLVETIDL